MIYCNDPGTVVNSVRTVRKGFFYLGSVEYRCNSNYKLDGVSRIYCKRDGNWSRPKPRCLGKNDDANASNFCGYNLRKRSVCRNKNVLAIL